MKRIVAASLMLLGACGQSQPKSKPAFTAEQLAKWRADDPGVLEACLQKVRFGGLDAFPEEVDQCYQMTPRQKWRGLWRNDFEGSEFCPAPAKDCSYVSKTERTEPSIWFDYQLPLPKNTKINPFGGLYKVEFLGRRTKYPGHFGHMGMSDHFMMVDSMLKIEEIEPPTGL